MTGHSTPTLPPQVSPPQFAVSDSLPHAVRGVEVIALPVLPAGPDDEHAVLVRVDPHSAEYWDSNDSKMVRLFAMAKAAITGTTPDLDSEHRTLKL